MKKLLAVIVAAFLLCSSSYAAPQRADRLSGSKVTSFGYVEDSSNATVTLVAGVTGQYVTLYQYVLSASTADNIYFKCGSTQKTAKKYFAANSGLDHAAYPFYFQCGSGEALSLVKGTSTTPIGIDLWFTQEP